MKYLLDTNVISELRKKSPDQNVLKWFETINSSDLYLSCITIGELKAGAVKKQKKDKKTGKILLQWVDKLVNDFEEQVININLNTCIEWSKLLVIDSTNAIDSLLAAQAGLNKLVLVTRNTKHFKMFNLQLLNPFEKQ